MRSGGNAKSQYMESSNNGGVRKDSCMADRPGSLRVRPVVRRIKGVVALGCGNRSGGLVEGDGGMLSPCRSPVLPFAEN